MKIGEVVVILDVLKFPQVSLNSNEKQNSFLMTHLTESPSDKGR